jgi:hypothetical protein
MSDAQRMPVPVPLSLRPAKHITSIREVLAWKRQVGQHIDAAAEMFKDDNGADRDELLVGTVVVGFCR